MIEKNLLVDILRTSSNRREKKVSVFKTILREIEDKIRRRLEEGGTSLAFEFPIVKPGLPTYDFAACASYAIKRLHNRGMDTEVVGAREIRVSWGRLLRAAKRQRTLEVLDAHKKRKEARARKKRVREEKSESDRRGPPIPPHAEDPDDLFSLPSVRGLKDLADVLRGI